MKVSIIIPCFNPKKEDFASAVFSCLEQTSLPDEILILDDGSDDLSGFDFELIRNSNRIHYHRLEHRGIGAVRNFGLEHAGGDYLVFLDCDDLISHAMIQTIKGCANSNADVIFFQAGAIGETDPNLYYFDVQGNTKIQGFLNRLVPYFGRPEIRSVWAKAFRKSFIELTGLRFENLAQGEDHLFMFEVSFTATRIRVFPNFTAYQYNERPGSLSRFFSEGKVKEFSDLINSFHQCIVRNHAIGSMKERELNYMVSSEYIPRLLKIVFCSEANAKPKHIALKEARRLFFADPQYKSAIKNCKIRDCFTIKKKIELVLLKMHLLAPLFVYYSQANRKSETRRTQDSECNSAFDSALH